MRQYICKVFKFISKKIQSGFGKFLELLIIYWFFSNCSNYINIDPELLELTISAVEHFAQT